jgi:hypothetical protein
VEEWRVLLASYLPSWLPLWNHFHDWLREAQSICFSIYIVIIYSFGWLSSWKFCSHTDMYK